MAGHPKDPSISNNEVANREPGGVALSEIRFATLAVVQAIKTMDRPRGTGHGGLACSTGNCHSLRNGSYL